MAEQFIGTVSTDEGTYKVKWDQTSGRVLILVQGLWTECGNTTDNTEEALAQAKAFALARETKIVREGGKCIIATACVGDDRVAPLRQLRDESIMSDPVARDFFHVFWSRYYEWSPGVARIAARDPAVADHIRWSFLDPWMAWLEVASLIGRRKIDELSAEERDEVLQRLGRRMEAWVDELPAHLEEKRPAEVEKVFEAFERFRKSAQSVFDQS